MLESWGRSNLISLSLKSFAVRAWKALGGNLLIRLAQRWKNELKTTEKWFFLTLLDWMFILPSLELIGLKLLYLLIRNFKNKITHQAILVKLKKN